MRLKPRVHQPEVVELPGRKIGTECLLPLVEIVAAIDHGSSQGPTPDRGGILARDNLRSDEFVGLSAVSGLDQRDRRKLGDVAHVDAAESAAADGLWIDAMA